MLYLLIIMFHNNILVLYFKFLKGKKGELLTIESISNELMSVFVLLRTLGVDFSSLCVYHHLFIDIALFCCLL